MRWVIDVLYLFGLLLTAPYWLYKSATAGKYRVGIWRKFMGVGVAEARLDGRPVVWFHAVSVGEVLLLKPLLRKLTVLRPDLQAVLSTTTETGFAVAKQTYSDLSVFFAPLDFSWAVQRTFARLDPALLVLAELELWPNLLLAAKGRRVPVAVVNARMSAKSFRGYRRFRVLLRPVFRAVDWWGAQTDEYAERIKQLIGEWSEPSVQSGVANKRPTQVRVAITGSIKYDGAPTDRKNAATAGLRRLFGLHAGDAVWVAGSTQGPEDDIVLDAFCQLRHRFVNLRLVLVPRQRERFDDAANAAGKRGLNFARRSGMDKPLQTAPTVILVDTVGELAAVWGLADVGFVGGSLDGVRGGQSMIEPAGYGVPVCFGPHVWNFRETVESLLACRGAVRLDSGAGLASAIGDWLEHPDQAAAMGQRARAFIMAQQGAVDATLVALEDLLATSQPARRCA